MEKLYNINDIQNFLYQHGVLWNGATFETSPHLSMIPAKLRLIDKNGEYEMFLQINYPGFKIYVEECNICYQETTYSYKEYKNLSTDWMKYLLNKYPNSADIIKNSIDNQKTKIMTNAAKEMLPLQKKINDIKKSAKEEIKYWDNLEKLLNLSSANTSSTAQK